MNYEELTTIEVRYSLFQKFNSFEAPYGQIISTIDDDVSSQSLPFAPYTDSGKT